MLSHKNIIKLCTVGHPEDGQLANIPGMKDDHKIKKRAGNLRYSLLLCCLLIQWTLSSALHAQIKNPVLAGFYPDPSICRVGSDYYIVNSTFAYFPGLPVFHSKDLVNWQQIGNAIDRTEQLSLQGVGVSRGLWAPAIKHHNGIFYITCTYIDRGSFVITAKNPAGPWSNPIWLKGVSGIDPSLFFDTDGRMFAVYNAPPPGGKSLYHGHSSIRMHQLDPVTFQQTGEEKLLVSGGSDITKKPIWVEGPHIFKKGNFYYLLCAEGGTEYNHSAVIFRSRNIEGPYESFAGNPILTQRHLDKTRNNPITSTGHASFVETPEGAWYTVFLGCRPYTDDNYNTGRETFLLPFTWKDGWPYILDKDTAVPYYVPMKTKHKITGNVFNGNYTYTDNFSSKQLNKRFELLRTPSSQWHQLDGKGLKLQLQTETVSGKGNPSFIGFRQAHLTGEATTKLLFKPLKENEKAGLLIFQNEDFYYFLCQSVKNGKPVVELYKSSGKTGVAKDSLLASAPISLAMGTTFQLKIEANGNHYDFYYSQEEDKWKLLQGKVDANFLSTTTAGGFVGAFYAMYATSSGMPSTNHAVFKKFSYKGDDDTFK
ncbi:glycoside hydrolase family 43 protein [Pedobacter chitinilyticus]|nr:glycoside hydrolase family 43 protein [Pedobacter chitinilyticus]